MAELEDRITELELRFTEQHQLFEDLSQVLYAQQQAIDLMTAELALLKRKTAGDPGLVDASDREKPPHY